MADLWNRVKPEGEDRVQIHLIVAGLEGYFVFTQDATKGATRTQVKSHLNAHLESPLTVGELADLDGIADALDAQPNIDAKHGYLFLLEYVMIAAETGDVSETKWRSDLGI